MKTTQGLKIGKGGKRMVSNFKSTAEEKAINQEIALFMKFLREDSEITEVNFSVNEVTYRSGSAMVSVTFKAKK